MQILRKPGRSQGGNTACGPSAARATDIRYVVIVNVGVVIRIIHHIRIAIRITVRITIITCIVTVVVSGVVGIIRIAVVVVIKRKPAVAPRIPVIPERVVVIGVIGRTVVINHRSIRRIITEIPMRTIPIPVVIVVDIHVNVLVVIAHIGLVR